MQRDIALKVVKSMPEGTVGHAISKCLAPVMNGLGPFRNIWAGKIGSFYTQNRDLLSKEATDANIEAFAKKETEFFMNQSLLTGAGLVGRMLSAQNRADLIKGGRDGSCFF